MTVSDSPEVTLVAETPPVPSPAPAHSSSASGRAGEGRAGPWLFGQLALLMDLGMSPARSLQLMADKASEERQRRLCLQLVEELQRGSSFLEAARAHRQGFSQWQLSWLAVAESTGDLEQVLPYLSRYQWLGIYARRMLLAAGLYLVVTIELCLLLLAGPVTQLCLLAIAALVGWRAWKVLAEPAKQLKLLRWLTKVPGCGRILDSWFTAEFSRALALQLESGVTLIQALPLAGHVLGPTLGNDLADQISAALLEDRSLTSTLQTTKFFTPRFLSFINVAEEVGSVSHVVAWLAETGEQEVVRYSEGLLKILRKISLLAFSLLLITLFVVPQQVAARKHEFGVLAPMTLRRVLPDAPAPAPTSEPTPDGKKTPTPKKPVKKKPASNK